jgi:DNA-binding transcriptional regulator YiaG
MANIAQALKSEIIRISRKEIKASVTPVRKSTVNLKQTLVELKKKVAALEAENKKRVAKITSEPVTQEASDPEKKIRLTAKGIRALRSKLGLSQDSFAKLLGVSSQAVYAMEHKAGAVKLRPATMVSYLAVREMKKGEAVERLGGIEKK